MPPPQLPADINVGEEGIGKFVSREVGGEIVSEEPLQLQSQSRVCLKEGGHKRQLPLDDIEPGRLPCWKMKAVKDGIAFLKLAQPIRCPSAINARVVQQHVAAKARIAGEDFVGPFARQHRLQSSRLDR